jgi:hypothetical protein
MNAIPLFRHLLAVRLVKLSALAISEVTSKIAVAFFFAGE